MKTKKVHGVDLHSRCFAHVGDESDPATWQLCVRVLGNEEKSVNAVKSSLHRFDSVKIPDGARERAWYTLRGAALALGIDVTERSFIRPTAETQKAPTTEPVKPQAPATSMQAAEHQPESVRVEPTFTYHKDLELEALIAESDRKAEQWLRILNLE